jgi:hypothetical protein
LTYQTFLELFLKNFQNLFSKTAGAKNKHLKEHSCFFLSIRGARNDAKVMTFIHYFQTFSKKKSQEKFKESNFTAVLFNYQQLA